MVATIVPFGSEMYFATLLSLNKYNNFLLLMKNQFNISVLEPVYNEQDSIKTLYSELKENLNGLYSWEVLLLNDGSTDNSKQVLENLRPGIFLINTSRGRIIDEKALYERLQSGAIAAAHLDVFATEPVREILDLFELPNFMGTPHSGAGAVEAWEAMARSGIRNLKENWVPEPGVYPYD